MLSKRRVSKVGPQYDNLYTWGSTGAAATARQNMPGVVPILRALWSSPATSFTPIHYTTSVYIYMLDRRDVTFRFTSYLISPLAASLSFHTGSLVCARHVHSYNMFFPSKSALIKARHQLTSNTRHRSINWSKKHTQWEIYNAK